MKRMLLAAPVLAIALAACSEPTDSANSQGTALLGDSRVWFDERDAQRRDE